MPAFSRSSNKKLNTAHEDLQVVFREVVKHFDCTVIYGRREAEQQFDLFKKGRFKTASEKWVVTNGGKVVTYKDGYIKKSRHQVHPGEVLSDAVDVVPYPIEWENIKRMLYFIGFVLGIARMLK